jgi:hypothetical protein
MSLLTSRPITPCSNDAANLQNGSSCLEILESKFEMSCDVAQIFLESLRRDLLQPSTVAEQYQRCFRPNDWLPVSVSDIYTYVGNLLLILPMCARPFLHLTWRYFSKRKGCAWTRYLEFKSQLFPPLYEGELGTWVYQ